LYHHSFRQAFERKKKGGQIRGKKMEGGILIFLFGEWLQRRKPMAHDNTLSTNLTAIMTHLHFWAQGTSAQAHGHL
jgi:hypothetical protein